MFMKDNKWVKLFITTENQVLVTIAATADGFKVTESTTIGGKVQWNIVIEGSSLDSSQKVFDAYDREAAAKYVIRAKNPQAEDVPTMPPPEDEEKPETKKKSAGKKPKK